MAAMTETKCAHPQCTCPVTEDEEFCSEACQEAVEEDNAVASCSCPHPDCARNAARVA